MSLIQWILLPSLLLIAGLYVRLFSHHLLIRLAILGLFVLGVYFVLAPDQSTHLAQSLGVGRGTDLLLYASVTGGYLVVLLLLAKIRHLEKVQRELIQAWAIREALPPQQPHTYAMPDDEE